MMHALHVIYSLPFFAGLVVGLTGYWVFLWQQCRWNNKHNPKPGGWRMGGVNSTYAAAAIVFGIVGYIVVSAQDTHDATVALARDVARCQIQFNSSLIARSSITAQDTDLANQQSDLRVRMDAARKAFLDELLNPPPNIVGLSRSDPLRDQYVMDAIRQYATWTNGLSTQINDVIAQRKKIQDDRESHPLTQGDCGRVAQ